MVTTILVSDAEKKLLEEAQNRILHAGLSALDEDVLEELKKFNIDIERFTRGSVVAIGAACILAKTNNHNNRRGEENGRSKK